MSISDIWGEVLKFFIPFCAGIFLGRIINEEATRWFFWAFSLSVLVHYVWTFLDYQELKKKVNL